MKKNKSDNLLCVPLTFVITNKGTKRYDYNAMISYFYNRLKLLGYNEENK